ncbi:hypothetical protein ACTPDT_10595 [Clostridioides difficile]|uniref:hypothetical protein n=1 Tax=Clostridioides difficile TaxID=1496 RepID=UPI0003B28984|nr:hypothetical protein [Clostridioides difficile]CCL01916.1 Conserved hypothetical protein [Clostridioides difficile E13]EGT2200393.1 hypothetical protein [Clostridioides difficile]EIS9334736.1 hypothetical protein [Clostridioides difficile]EIS9370945.1 hypothetical protein [Clostridioides difficile]EIS9585280.1 hypothetical protein [Clostridioides difficile]
MIIFSEASLSISYKIRKYLFIVIFISVCPNLSEMIFILVPARRRTIRIDNIVSIYRYAGVLKLINYSILFL